MRRRLPLILLVTLALALTSLGPALGQTADPTWPRYRPTT
jgi:hypothetical protein